MTDANTLPRLLRLALETPGDESALRALTRELVRLGYNEAPLTTEQKARDFAANFKGCGEWVWGAPYSILSHSAARGASMPRALAIQCFPDGFLISLEWGHYVFRTRTLSFDFSLAVFDLVREIGNSNAGAGPQATALHYLFFYITGDHDEASRMVTEATR